MLNIHGQVCGYELVTMVKPAPLSDGMPSAGGTSIQSTWPERSAASRALASGIGSSRIASTLAMWPLSQ